MHLCKIAIRVHELYDTPTPGLPFQMHVCIQIHRQPSTHHCGPMMTCVQSHRLACTRADQTAISYMQMFMRTYMRAHRQGEQHSSACACMPTSMEPMRRWDRPVDSNTYMLNGIHACLQRRSHIVDQAPIHAHLQSYCNTTRHALLHACVHTSLCQGAHSLTLASRHHAARTA